MKKFSLVLVFLCSLFLTACLVTTTNDSVSDRSQLMLISSEEVDENARVAYNEEITSALQKGRLNKNKNDVKRVKKIANRLIEKAELMRADSAEWDWKVNVVDDPTVNAWCMPGGRIVVYSGMIHSLKLTDDELAIVIGHEIAHALREHVREQQSADMLKQVGFSLASLFVDTSILQLADYSTMLAFSLPFSRTHETEADMVGLELCAMAGYDVDAGARVWRKMNELQGGGSDFAFFSTHPSNDDRIENLEQTASKLKIQYNIK